MLKPRYCSINWRGFLVTCVSCALLFSPVRQLNASQAVIGYTKTLLSDAQLVLDSRRAKDCQKASLKGARCLPVSDVLGPGKVLANFSGLLWLLGTAGLTGSEHVAIIGDKLHEQEFWAGVLFLAGQRKISILTTPVSSLAQNRLAPGTARSKSREKVYQSTMRADQIILRSDLLKIVRSHNAPVIIDGRTENEYWGNEVKAMRGGHVPGAQLLPLGRVRLTSDKSPLLHISKGDQVISYSRNTYDSLIYLAVLRARGIPAKIYLEGWQGWASDGALPADNVSYRNRRAPLNVGDKTKQPAVQFSRYFFIISTLAGLFIFTVGYFTRRAIKG